MRIVELTDESKNNILENLLKRSPNSYGKFESAVAEILLNIKTKGDEALFEYTKNFDKADINADNIVVTEAEIEEAYSLVDPELIEVIRKAIVNIRSFHEKQKQYSWFDSKPDGTILGQKVTALARVGVYVPGPHILSTFYQRSKKRFFYSRSDHADAYRTYGGRRNTPRFRVP